MALASLTICFRLTIVSLNFTSPSSFSDTGLATCHDRNHSSNDEHYDESHLRSERHPPAEKWPA
jgi:hypothetical protein